MSWLIRFRVRRFKELKNKEQCRRNDEGDADNIEKGMDLTQ